MPIYGPSGLRTGVKAWMGTTLTTNGMWSVNISSAGCTAAPFNIQTQALSKSQTAAGALQSTLTSASATTLSGAVTQPATVSLLGVLSINLFTAGQATIYVQADCQ